jgi:hypothetical protein
MTTWKRKILRKILGEKCENVSWKLRINVEVQNVRKSVDILTEIKVKLELMTCIKLSLDL